MIRTYNLLFLSSLVPIPGTLSLSFSVCSFYVIMLSSWNLASSLPTWGLPASPLCYPDLGALRKPWPFGGWGWGSATKKQVPLLASTDPMVPSSAERLLQAQALLPSPSPLQRVVPGHADPFLVKDTTGVVQWHSPDKAYCSALRVAGIRQTELYLGLN